MAELKALENQLQTYRDQWQTASAKQKAELELLIDQAETEWVKLKIKKGEVPKVSVVMSVYNTEKFVEAALKSILKQTMVDFEVVLIDDGSADKSMELVKQFGDPRVRIIHQTNHGLVYSFNKGIRLARADFIARMDADDICLPSRFEKELAWLQADKRRGLVGAFFAYIDEETSKSTDVVMTCPPKHLDVARMCYIVNPFGHGSIMMRKEAVEELGGYRSEYEPSEDYDLWRRMVNSWQVGQIPEVLYLWRFHPGSISRRKADVSNASAARTVANMWAAKPIYKSAFKINSDAKFYRQLNSALSERLYEQYLWQQERLVDEFFEHGKGLACLQTILGLALIKPNYLRRYWKLMFKAALKYNGTR